MLRRLILNLLLHLLGVSHETPRKGDVLITCPLLEHFDTWWWVLLVRWRTGSLWTHAAIADGDGHVIEAIAGSTVRVAPVPRYYLLLTMDLTEREREALVRWAKMRVGQPYNWKQFAAAGSKQRLLRRLAQHMTGYVCTQLAWDDYFSVLNVKITKDPCPTPVEIVRSPVLQRA